MNGINELELNIAMLRKNVNSQQMADAIQKSRVTFNSKSNGKVPFYPEEILVLRDALTLSLEQVDTIFFGGHLLDGNFNRHTTS